MPVGQRVPGVLFMGSEGRALSVLSGEVCVCELNLTMCSMHCLLDLLLRGCYNGKKSYLPSIHYKYNSGRFFWLNIVVVVGMIMLKQSSVENGLFDSRWFQQSWNRSLGLCVSLCNQ